MREDSQSSAASPHLSIEKRVDRACDRFEAAWATGPRPSIQDFLSDAPETDRSALFRALLKLEIDLRRRHGESPSPNEYEVSFADYREAVQAIFAGAPTDGGSTPDGAGHPERPPAIPARIGRYKIRSKLGGGTFGDVYLGDDDLMDRQVAIKVPSARLLASQNARDQFLSEARSVGRLRHEGIVLALDVGQEDDGTCYIVYEFIEGTNLEKRIASDERAPDPLTPAESARLVARLAFALHHAHLQGLFHRDIKPANILLDRQGRPFLTDFGLAVREEDLWKERGHLAGTLPYMSPEQVRREGHHVDGRSDIYSLGVVLYELLAGRRPFGASSADELKNQILFREARPPRQIKDDVPPELERVCMRALSKRVQDRYSTAKDMAKELLDALGSTRSERDADSPPSPVEFEERMASADAAELRRLLRQVQHAADPAYVPQIFRCLSHPSEPVRQQARSAVHALGLDKVAEAAEELARRQDTSGIAAVLGGIAAFEAHPQIVTLLDRLLVLLKGDLRNRAILLLERKRLGLELDVVAGLFRDIHSPYRIERALGQGLFAASYLARTEGTDLAVVVRVLRPELAQQPHLRTQFLDLNKNALHLVHENLVLTREARAFPDRGMYFAVRDFVDGATLQKVLDGGKIFDAGQIFGLLAQLTAALGAVHRRGICHGGVKPSNVFLCTDGKVILGDLSQPVHGVGVALDRLSYDYRYAAPEFFCGGEPAGPQSDFYALGCVAYQLFCGEPPFVSDNYVELAASHLHKTVVPPSRQGGRAGPEHDWILLKLLARQAKERYGTADDLLQALSEALRPPRNKPAPAPAPPLLRDASLARYQPPETLMGFEASLASEPSARALSDASLPRSGARQQFEGTMASPTPARIGNYQILARIGMGGMGTIFKARDELLGRVVALKVLDPPGRMLRVDDATSTRNTRLLTEARAVATLQHPNIVQVHGIGEYEGSPYLVLEFVDGGSLAEKLRTERPEPRAAAATVAKLARAVHHAHERGVLHRDLKPSNVLLTSDGEPKIADFGLAKLHHMGNEDAALTRSGMILGTPSYMAPEQASGNVRSIGPPADVYGLGAILYESLTGRPPFKGSGAVQTLHQIATAEVVAPERLNAAVDRGLSTICLTCLRKEPQKRYATAAALADDLERWQRGLTLSASAPPVVRRLARWWNWPFAGWFRKQR
jgi:serine/threonine protein kinase